MQLQDLKPKHKIKERKRVGRGGKRGTYSGRGMKGQKSRSGRTTRPAIRGFIKRYHKLRGYQNKARNMLGQTVDLDQLNKNFKDSEKVSPASLVEKGVVSKIKGRLPKIKILSDGDIKKKLEIEDCRISAKAKEKVEKAGGKVLCGTKK
jgi:large subunit ribosomal protein L15